MHPLLLLQGALPGECPGSQGRKAVANYEINVIIDNAEFGGQVSDMFSQDLDKSRRITLEEHESRTWFEIFLEKLCDPIRRCL